MGMRTYNATLDKLRAFVKESFDREWSEAEADSALIGWLDNRSVDVLGAFVDGRPIPSPQYSGVASEYLVNAFAKHALERDPEGFEFLQSVVKGAFLTNALLYPDLGAVNRRFASTEFYFDTPVLLRALGLSVPEQRTAATELLELLYASNAHLRCFRHTFDEMQSVLNAVTHQLQLGDVRYSFGETVNYLIDHGWTALDVEEIRIDLERRLEALHVAVEDTPPHQVELTLDESRLAELLDAEVGPGGYANPNARDKDVDSLTAIHRLRGGGHFVHLEDARAVFVTTNAAVARASSKYYRSEVGRHEIGATVPLCMLDWTLTTLVWVKQPTSAPDLPRARLIADISAGLTPSDALWVKYADEIDRLRERGDLSAERYGLLRYSMTARRALMDLTLGDEASFGPGTVQEVLRASEAAVRADVEAELEDAEAARGHAEVRIRATEAQLRDAETARGRAEDQATVSEAELLRVTARVDATAQSIARLVGRGAFVILFTAALVGSVISVLEFPWPVPRPIALSSALGFLVLLLMLANLVLGTTVQSLSRTVEYAIEKRLKSLLRRQFGVDPASRA
ncbi:MAG: hypothetical protein F4X25_02275 [Chloroflexi bacterium]|nr:hypothetical protein [Chloroflexota bacterium]